MAKAIAELDDKEWEKHKKCLIDYRGINTCEKCKTLYHACYSCESCFCSYSTLSYFEIPLNEISEKLEKNLKVQVNFNCCGCRSKEEDNFSWRIINQEGKVDQITMKCRKTKKIILNYIFKYCYDSDSSDDCYF